MTFANDTAYRVDLRRYLKLYPNNHPFRSRIWDDFVLRPAWIRRFFREGKLRAEGVMMYAGRRCRVQHEQRVAWLMRHGWADAIEIDLGVPSMGCAPWINTDDGNHRVAAALLLRHRVILATVSGEVRLIKQIVWTK